MSAAIRKSICRLLTLATRKSPSFRTYPLILSNRDLPTSSFTITNRLIASKHNEEVVMNININEVLEEGKKGVQIIDVRELVEIHETGLIPGSVNIPLGHLEEAMKMSPEEFKERYGVNQPEKNQKIIMSCRSGARSKRAILALQGLGYTNLYNNENGWLGYEDLIKKKDQE